jgi:hypothetical protein
MLNDHGDADPTSYGDYLSTIRPAVLSRTPRPAMRRSALFSALVCVALVWVALGVAFGAGYLLAAIRCS